MNLFNIIKYLLITVFMLSGLSSCKAQKNSLGSFLPQGYVIYEKHFGDLNNDGIEDCVLIIKGTNKKNMLINRFEKEVDRNRRGIIILLNKKEKYQTVTENFDCFYSENEEGGVYYPPQLSINIEEGNLLIQFEHGRYGYWQYTFKYQNLNFELMTYNSGDLYENEIININFLSKKKTVETYDEENKFINETIKNIDINKRIILSEINDFEALDMSIY